MDLPVEMEFFASLARRLPVDLTLTEVRLVGLCRRCMNALDGKGLPDSSVRVGSSTAARDREAYESAAAEPVAKHADAGAQPQEGGE